MDSAFDLKKDAGVVLSQMPDTGAFVKRGRTVFIVVNKSQAPLTPMPDLMGVSYRTFMLPQTHTGIPASDARSQRHFTLSLSPSPRWKMPCSS